MEELLLLVKPLVEAYAGKLGPVVQLVALMGSFRVFLKPFQLLEKPLLDLIKATPSKKDDELFEKAKGSKAFKLLKFVVDYLFSLKLK